MTRDSRLVKITCALQSTDSGWQSLPFVADRAKETDGDNPAECRENDGDDNHVSTTSPRPSVHCFPWLGWSRGERKVSDHQRLHCLTETG